MNIADREIAQVPAGVNAGTQVEGLPLQGTGDASLARLGMWFFLASEGMFFVAMLGAFVVLESTAEQHRQFVQSSKLLSRPSGIAACSLLVLASAALRWKRGCWLAVAAGVGCLMVFGLQSRVGFPHDNFFGSYMLFTWVHAIHLLAGILAMMWYLLFRKADLPAALQNYWHFVNAVGIIGLLTLYFA